VGDFTTSQRPITPALFTLCVNEVQERGTTFDERNRGGIERAIFGEVTADDITAWLNQYVHRRLSLGVQTVLFRAGRLAAVYGLQLTNGLAIVAKVYRGANIERLAAAASCQGFLADAHYPCPAPLEAPGEVDGRIVLLETLLDRGEQGDAHSAATRACLKRPEKPFCIVEFLLVSEANSQLNLNGNACRLLPKAPDKPK
jgi:hypothetical protein